MRDYFPGFVGFAGFDFILINLCVSGYFLWCSSFNSTRCLVRFVYKVLKYKKEFVRFIAGFVCCGRMVQSLFIVDFGFGFGFGINHLIASFTHCFNTDSLFSNDQKTI